MEWYSKFPEMGRSELREFKKSVDNALPTSQETMAKA